MFVPWMMNPLPMLLTVEHDVGFGAACGAGVAASPWWNVEPP
jgi:hypothetical protein